MRKTGIFFHKQYTIVNSSSGKQIGPDGDVKQKIVHAFLISLRGQFKLFASGEHFLGLALTPIGRYAGGGLECFKLFYRFFEQGFGSTATTAELFGRVT